MKKITNLILKKIKKVITIIGFYFMWLVEYPKSPAVDEKLIVRLRQENKQLFDLILSNKNTEEIIEEAERIMHGQYVVCGKEIEFNIENIQWHRDFYSGFQWPLKSFVRIWDPNDSKLDLNVPFELSRMHFVPKLIQAYEIKKDDKFLLHLEKIIDSWIRNNPYCIGINWWSGMEVGIRAINLCVAIVWLYPILSKKKLRLYCDLLWRHFTYIYKYDVINDKIGNKNTHYLGSLTGLAASVFIFQKEYVEEYLQFTKNEMVREIERQFHSDGSTFESAVGYHQYALEIVLIYMIIYNIKYQLYSDGEKDVKKALKEEYGDNPIERIELATEFVWDYMKTFGQSPNIGDNSDSRVLKIDSIFNNTPLDHSFIFDLYESVFNKKYQRPVEEAKLYSYGGFGIVKGRNYGLIAFAGPKGTNGTGGHGHNDKLSFTLAVNKIPFLIDPGTYIYNSDLTGRYLFKRSDSHNVMILDGKEQCEISQETAFGLIGNIDSTIKMERNKNKTSIKMNHNGYQLNYGYGNHRRNLDCYIEKISITDIIDGTSDTDRRIEINFIAHPSCKVKIEKKSVLLQNKEAVMRLEFQEDLTIELEKIAYSPMYHEIDNTIRIIGRGRFSLPAEIRTNIEILA
jgi:hypothetical protein